jgi:hypothetical protein
MVIGGQLAVSLIKIRPYWADDGHLPGQEKSSANF